MKGKMNLKWAIIDSGIASIWAFLLGYIISAVSTSYLYGQPMIGVFPIYSNIIEFGVLVIATFLGVVTTEELLGKELYEEHEVSLGAGILGILGVLTVGLGVPPFNVRPLPAAIASTVFVEMLVINVFALAFSKEI